MSTLLPTFEKDKEKGYRQTLAVLEKSPRDTSEVKKRLAMDQELSEEYYKSVKIGLPENFDEEIVQFIKEYAQDPYEYSAQYYAMFEELLGKTFVKKIIEGKNLAPHEKNYLITKYTYRLLDKRPYAFYGHTDQTWLQDGTYYADGIGKGVEIAHHSAETLKKLISYPETRLSQKMIMAGKTKLYTGGSLYQISDKPVKDKNGVEVDVEMVSLIGLRTEREMDEPYKALIISDNNQKGNLWNILSAKAKKDEPLHHEGIEYANIHSRAREGQLFINLTQFKNEIKAVYQNYFDYCNHVAMLADKPAHVSLTFLGLSSWLRFTPGTKGGEDENDFRIEVLRSFHLQALKEIFTENIYPNINKIDLAVKDEDNTEGLPEIFDLMKVDRLDFTDTSLHLDDEKINRVPAWKELYEAEQEDGIGCLRFKNNSWDPISRQTNEGWLGEYPSLDGKMMKGTNTASTFDPTINPYLGKHQIGNRIQLFSSTGGVNNLTAPLESISLVQTLETQIQRINETNYGSSSLKNKKIEILEKLIFKAWETPSATTKEILTEWKNGDGGSQEYKILATHRGYPSKAAAFFHPSFRTATIKVIDGFLNHSEKEPSAETQFDM